MGSNNDSNKQPLNNNSTFRGRVSNTLDKAFEWVGYNEKESKTRATLHAGYHETQHQLGKFTNSKPYKAVNETLKKFNSPVTLPTVPDNPREHQRAKDQWGIVTGGPTDNLEKYDAEQKM